MTIEQFFCLATSISSYFFSFPIYFDDNVFVKSVKGEDTNVEKMHYWYCIKLWSRISWWWKFFKKWSRRSLQLPVNVVKYSHVDYFTYEYSILKRIRSRIPVLTKKKLLLYRLCSEKTLVPSPSLIEKKRMRTLFLHHMSSKTI